MTDASSPNRDDGTDPQTPDKDGSAGASSEDDTFAPEPETEEVGQAGHS